MDDGTEQRLSRVEAAPELAVNLLQSMAVDICAVLISGLEDLAIRAWFWAMSAWSWAACFWRDLGRWVGRDKSLF